MKYRVCQILLLTALVVPFSSCPVGAGTPNVVGLWLITYDTSAGTLTSGLEFLEGGSAVEPLPPPAAQTASFGRSATWVQDGSVVTMSQIGSGGSRIWTGIFESNTKMSGTFDDDGTAIRAWSGVKLI